MARQPLFGPRWQPRDIKDPTHWDGCEAVARRIQVLIGGEIKVIRPRPEFAGLALGDYRGTAPGWIYHQVVVKEDRVFDMFTGHRGIPIAEYKMLWNAADALEFGF